MTPEFGKPITKAEADELFNRANEIVSTSQPKLMSALSGEKDALDFFTSPFAFIFSQRSLEPTLKKLSSGSYFVILHGAKDRLKDGTVADRGRPVVMCLVYHLSEDGKNLVLDTTSTGSETESLTTTIGTEHPGTPKPPPSMTIPGGVPVIIPISAIEP